MVPQVTPARLKDWFAQAGDASAGPPTPLLLDVREPWEVQTASVRPDGFELRAIPMSAIPQQLGALPTDRPIACLCHHGSRSQQVAVFLARNGFEPVANVAGGIALWSRELDPSVPQY